MSDYANALPGAPGLSQVLLDSCEIGVHFSGRKVQMEGVAAVKIELADGSLQLEIQRN